MELEKFLEKIGKTTFVKYFTLFEKNKWAFEIRNQMREIDNYAEDTLRTKAAFGRRIFKAHLEKKALESIIKSERLEKSVITKAKRILKRLNDKKQKK
jgi:hypothetical protein